jgi:hypothetical protein
MAYFLTIQCGDDRAAKTELSDNVGEHERDDDDRRDAHQPKNNWHVSLLRDHLDRTHTKPDEGYLVPSFRTMKLEAVTCNRLHAGGRRLAWLHHYFADMV